MNLRDVIRDIPNFPQPGILFRDITPVLEEPEAFKLALKGMSDLLADVEFDTLAAIESRGFIFASPLAVQSDKRFVLLRKAGKLPCPTHRQTYQLEYGEAILEIHRDSLAPGSRVIVIDDLLATGGTAQAAGQLVKESGAEIAAYLFFVELGFLGGREKLDDANVFSLVKYD